MLTRTSLAVSGLALSAFLIGAPVAAQNAGGPPANESTPAEKAATAALNEQVNAGNRAADAQTDANNAQYQTQQQQYQNRLQENQAAQQNYQDQTAIYHNLRDRYAAERRAYRRNVWPERYARWTLDRNDEKLIGERVEIINGERVGTIIGVVQTPAGRVEGLEVRLDNDKTVWIDAADARYSRADRVLMTNLDRADLWRMADLRL